MIETERLILRAWRDGDVAPFHAMCNDAAVMRFLGPHLSFADAQAAAERQNGFIATYGSCFWAVERREDGAFLGFTGIKPGPDDTPIAGEPEIGWRLATPFQGQGYAREAAQASLNWHWENLAGDNVFAITVRDNLPSWGLMERLGMIRRHDLDFYHPAVPPDNPLRPHITYSIARPR
ncbi:MAG: GNAT family N-acetyltransferase [Sphingomonadales bacterium]